MSHIAKEKNGIQSWADISVSCVLRRNEIPLLTMKGLYGWRVDGAGRKGSSLNEGYIKAIHQTDPLPVTFHYITEEQKREIHKEFRAMNESQVSGSRKLRPVEFDYDAQARDRRHWKPSERRAVREDGAETEGSVQNVVTQPQQAEHRSSLSLLELPGSTASHSSSVHGRHAPSEALSSEAKRGSRRLSKADGPGVEKPVMSGSVTSHKASALPVGLGRLGFGASNFGSVTGSSVLALFSSSPRVAVLMVAATSRSIQISLLVSWLLHLATAEKTCNGCTAGVGLLQKSPRQHVMVVPGVPYDWYPVDGGDGRACRGATSHDNQASYYSVVSGIPSIDQCKDECLKHSNCSGVEFSGTRCEVWTRPEGIQASIALENFQCWSYQPSLFEAVDGGLDRSCQGTSASDVVQQGIQTISDCKLQCVATPACKGIEFAAVGGTCKLLTGPAPT
eukprot:s1091_g21.t3